MKYLFKISPPIWPVFVYEFSLIKKLIKNKNKLLIWVCSGDKKKISFCHANPEMSKVICLACKSKLKNALKEINGNYEIYKDINKNKKLNTNFENFLKKNKSKNLSNIRYKNIDLGKGVESTLYTYFKSNFEIYKNNSLKNLLLEESFYTLDTIIEIKKNYKFSDTYLFNGRHYNYRPILKYLSSLGDNVYCYDVSNYSERLIISKNEYPHNLISRAHNLIKIKKLKSNKKLIKAGKNFFKKRFEENRSNNLIDNYEFSQNQSLPKNFDNSKLNISFFNTALWEFQSIVENEKYYLFKNDFEFLKFLKFKFKKEKDINFYFRCHPNMVNEKNYLKKISVILKNFNNLKFIHPESEISTKELIRNSDLIINFGSSVSIEGGYYGKKIVTLAPSIFLYFSFQEIFYSKKNLIVFIKNILKMKKKKMLKLDKKIFNDAILAAGCAYYEGLHFNNVKVLDRYKQIYFTNKKKLILKPSFFFNFFYLSFMSFKAFKRIINFTFINFNLSINKLLTYINRLKNI